MGRSSGGIVLVRVRTSKTQEKSVLDQLWISMVIPLLLLFLSSTSAKPTEEMESKVCWRNCMDNSPVQSMKMLGCHRRSTFPHSENFRCDAKESGLERMGPPC